jgi:hypothetical protein
MGPSHANLIFWLPASAVSSLAELNCRQSHVMTDGQSVLVSSPIWGSWPDSLGYNGSLVIWTVVCLTAANLSLLYFLCGLRLVQWETRFHGFSVVRWCVVTGTMCCGCRCLAMDIFPAYMPYYLDQRKKRQEDRENVIIMSFIFCRPNIHQMLLILRWTSRRGWYVARMEQMRYEYRTFNWQSWREDSTWKS